MIWFVRSTYPAARPGTCKEDSVQAAPVPNSTTQWRRMPRSLEADQQSGGLRTYVRAADSATPRSLWTGRAPARP